MNIQEILEGIKNTGKIFDILRGNQDTAREIRQLYNKVLKGKVKLPNEKESERSMGRILKNQTINTIQHSINSNVR